jgi:hypothetical protein
MELVVIWTHKVRHKVVILAKNDRKCPKWPTWELLCNIKCASILLNQTMIMLYFSSPFMLSWPLFESMHFQKVDFSENSKLFYCGIFSQVWYGFFHQYKSQKTQPWCHNFVWRDSARGRGQTPQTGTGHHFCPQRVYSHTTRPFNCVCILEALLPCILNNNLQRDETIFGRRMFRSTTENTTRASRSQ